jgi:hypothetical protein
LSKLHLFRSLTHLCSLITNKSSHGSWLTIYYTIGDRQLAETLRSGVDTYTAIVRGIYGKEELTDEERQTGKVLFLSLMYGGGIGTVMRQFGVDGATAKANGGAVSSRLARGAAVAGRN